MSSTIKRKRKPDMAAGRIVHLSTAHQVNDSRVFYRECRTAASYGYETFLIGVGEQDSVSDGVTIQVLPSQNRRIKRLLFNMPNLLYKALKCRGQVYHFHDPEIIPIGVLLRLLGRHVVFDVHEDFPKEMYSKTYIPKELKPLFSYLMAGLIKIADYTMSTVIVAVPNIGDRFRRQGAVVVQNYPDIAEFDTDPKEFLYEERPNRAVFAGNMNSIRCGREIVAALADSRFPKDFELDLVGRVNPPAFERELAVLPGWERVNVFGWVGPEEVSRYFRSARFGLVVYAPVPNHINAQPRKLFEYMAAGLPVIASDFAYWRQIINGAGCGLLVDPNDPGAIADAMLWMQQNPEEAFEMGRRGKAAVQDKFNWQNEQVKLLGVYEELFT